MSPPREPRLARRAVLGLIAVAAASPSLFAGCAPAPDRASARRATDAAPVPARRPAGPAGTLTDPDLLHPVVPWPLTLDRAERRTLRALCDLILPADGASPAAGALGADAFLDEWVSAPYPAMRRDGVLLREGLAWLDAQAARRSAGAGFATLAAAEQAALCEPICDPANAPPGLQAQALFFDRVRELACIAHYTTAEGMADLGYVGNVALEAWQAPPAAVLRKAGLE